MAEQKQVFKCNVCGQMTEVLRGGVGTLVCCEQPMQLLAEQTADSSTEKHVPVIERTETGVLVKVGSIPHPMEEKHYIEWIEVIADGRVYRKYLQPGDAPEAEFRISAENIEAREFCNIHGLWKS
jgi:superoxide reductase